MNTLSKMSKISKFFLLLGGAVTLLSLIASTVLYVCAGRLGEYYTLTLYSKEMIICARQCAGVTFLATIFFEIITRNNDNR